MASGVNRSGILHSILNVTNTSRQKLAAKWSPSNPTVTRQLLQPSIHFPAAPDYATALKRLKIPKKVAGRLVEAYLARVASLRTVVETEAGKIWTSLLQTQLADEDMRDRFYCIIGIQMRSFVDSADQLYEKAIEIVLAQLKVKKNVKPKWDKKWVPLLVWWFTSPNGQYPNEEQRDWLSKTTGLSPKQITVWFQNRRARTKKRLAQGKPVPKIRDSLPPIPDFCLKCLRPHLPCSLEGGSKRKSGRRLKRNIVLSDQVDQSDPVQTEEKEEINILDHANPPPGSFPAPSEPRIYTKKLTFPPTKWPRPSRHHEGLYVPVNNGEILILHREFRNMNFGEIKEDVDVKKLCQSYISLHLEGGEIEGEDEDDNNTDEDDDEESLEDLIVPTDSLDDENIPDADREVNRRLVNPLDPPPPEPKTMSTSRSEEESRSILRRGVGKVPLIRRSNIRRPQTASSRAMLPPSTVRRQRPKKLAVTKNIFNGRRKRVPKHRLPIIRELPSLQSHQAPAHDVLVENTQEYPEEHAHHFDAPEDEFQAALDDCNQEDISEDITEDELEYYSYSEDDNEENPPTIALVDFQQAIEASHPVTTSWLDGPKFPRFNGSVYSSEGSWSGSSHQDSDMDDIEIACQEGVSLSFLEPHELLEPPQKMDLPECFNIPYDPEIAEVALQETLESLGITHCPYPAEHNALDLQTWQIKYGPEHVIDLDATTKRFEVDKWSREFYQDDVGPTVTEPSLPTFVEEYNATLPILTEDNWCLSSADFEELQALTATRMQQKRLEPIPEALSADLSQIFDLVPTDECKAPYPAYFIPVLPEPEPLPVASASSIDDYGDGSQFLVEFENEEPSSEPFIPIFTEEDFLPESERDRLSALLPLDDYLPFSESDYYALNNYMGVSSQTSAPPLYRPVIQPMSHLPPISSMDPDGTETTAGQTSSTAQKFLDFLASLPGSLVSSLTSLIGSNPNTDSTRSNPTPETQQFTSVDFSDTEDFKRELTEYANLRVYGTTTSPYDDPNIPTLW
ncbi:hypothetical protein CPB86DRAFT_793657 [Serendipita vermifera]|nr:hypothetical protein CPB86DRAFT_793657 [Serendipita vermifera]